MALLKPREIMKKYKISNSSLIRWNKEGKLSCFKTDGGHRRYLSEEIDTIFSFTKKTKAGGQE